MAIRKSYTWKSFELTYWVIWDLISNKKNGTSRAIMMPYKDEDSRVDDINNCIKDAAKSVEVVGHGLTLKQAYNKILALSIPFNYVISPETPAELDPVTGEVIREMIPEIIEVRDHNFFKNAESLL